MSFLSKIFGSGGKPKQDGIATTAEAINRWDCSQHDLCLKSISTSSKRACTHSPCFSYERSLRNVEQMLLKKQDFLEEKIKKELEIIKTNGTVNKRASLAALKRKKRFEKQQEQLDGSCDKSKTPKRIQCIKTIFPFNHANHKQAR